MSNHQNSAFVLHIKAVLSPPPIMFFCPIVKSFNSPKLNFAIVSETKAVQGRFRPERVPLALRLTTLHPVAQAVMSSKVKSESVVIQSCPTLGNPMECSPPGSSVHGILQARILEWVAIPFSRGCLLNFSIRWPLLRLLQK